MVPTKLSTVYVNLVTFIRGTFLPKKSATKDGKTPATPPPTGFPAQLSKSIQVSEMIKVSFTRYESRYSHSQTLLKKHYEHAVSFLLIWR